MKYSDEYDQHIVTLYEDDEDSIWYCHTAEGAAMGEDLSLAVSKTLRRINSVKAAINAFE